MTRGWMLLGAGMAGALLMAGQVEACQVKRIPGGTDDQVYGTAIKGKVVVEAVLVRPSDGHHPGLFLTLRAFGGRAPLYVKETGQFCGGEGRISRPGAQGFLLVDEKGESELPLEPGFVYWLRAKGYLDRKNRGWIDAGR